MNAPNIQPAIASIRSAGNLIAESPLTAVLTALAGVLASMLGVGLVMLVLVLVVFAGLDMVTGALRAALDEPPRFSKRVFTAGVQKKFMRLTLVVVALGLDASAIAMTTEGIADLWSKYTPLAAGTTAYLLLVEAGSVVANVTATEGVGVVFPGLAETIARWRERLSGREGGG